MTISKFKAIFALLTGGVGGILKYLNTVINTQILGKIKDKETALKYLKDAQALYALVNTIFVNHGDTLSEGKKKAVEAVLAAINELIKVLEDFQIEENEIASIIEKVNAAINAFKKAK